MATQLFLRGRGTSNIGDFMDLSTTRGVASRLMAVNTPTTAGGTNIQFLRQTSQNAEWISGRSPSGGWTLAGTVTVNLRALETSMNANVGGRLRLYKRTAAGSESEIGGSPWDDGAEFGTADGPMNWTFTPTSTAFAEDDRLIVRFFGTGVGTMASGFAFNLSFDGPTGGAAGDSYVTLNETVTFKSNDPFHGFFHCNGTDGSTTFPVEGDVDFGDLAVQGNAQVDTAQSVFGGASALFDGTGDELLTSTAYNRHPMFVFGRDLPFTIDFRLRLASLAAHNGVVGLGQNNAQMLTINVVITTGVIEVTDNAGALITGSALSINTWYHIALTRDSSNDMRLFVDGTQVGSTFDDSGKNWDALGATFSSPEFGAVSPLGRNLNGWLDEVRIRNGEAVWTADFTPPTTEYGGHVGSASGTGTAAAVGAATAAASGSATGTGTAAATGIAIVASAGAAAGAGAAVGVGQAIQATVGSAAGTGAAAAVGDTVAGFTETTGTASGTGTASAVGAATAAVTGSAAGTGAATGVGAATAAVTGSAAGTGAAAATGLAIVARAGSATGTGAAAALSIAITARAGSASGTGTATGIGAATAASVGSAVGTGTAIGLAEAGTAVGSASGTGAAVAVGHTIISIVGSASGTGTAAAVALVGSVGSATGTGTASAVGNAITARAGTAIGAGAAAALSIAITARAGSASGAGAAAGIGAATASTTAAASGTGAAAATSETIRAMIGSASGTGAAAAVAFVGSIGTAIGTGAAAAVGAEIRAMVGSASGSGAAAGISAAGTAVGAASGTGTAAAVGHTIIAITGLASGSGTADAVSTRIESAVGESWGAGAANAVTPISAVGSASGTGEASAVSAPVGLVESVGTASATGTASAVSAPGPVVIPFYTYPVGRSLESDYGIRNSKLGRNRYVIGRR